MLYIFEYLPGVTQNIAGFFSNDSQLQLHTCQVGVSFLRTFCKASREELLKMYRKFGVTVSCSFPKEAVSRVRINMNRRVSPAQECADNIAISSNSTADQSCNDLVEHLLLTLAEQVDLPHLTCQ